jgi:hypothetical protein
LIEISERATTAQKSSLEQKFSQIVARSLTRQVG